jgi:hypothetical protein
MPHIAFLTLILGLVSGPQTIRLAVDAVQTVGIMLGGKTLATIQGPPWTALVDFGGELTPRTLEAVGYDSHGDEVTRASQVLNLPRPPAELEIAIRNEGPRPVLASLMGSHRSHEHPTRGQLSIDGKNLPLRRDFSAPLPALDWSRPHVLSAEMRFADGAVAKRELVMAGGVGESVGSELTPVLVVTTGSHAPASIAGCFSKDGVELRTSALEKPEALVVMVKDPDPSELEAQLDGFERDFGQYGPRLELSGDTKERILWPVAQRFRSSGEPTSIVFERSEDITAHGHGMLWLLRQTLAGSLDGSERKGFADAVAVAGISSMASPRRRAVIVVLNKKPKEGTYASGVVRRYLENVGVPVFVWSAGPQPELTGPWGAIDDISTKERLAMATAKVNAALDQQRIAWIATDPLGALDLEVKEQCGLSLVAHRPR